MSFQWADSIDDLQALDMWALFYDAIEERELAVFGSIQAARDVVAAGDDVSGIDAISAMQSRVHTLLVAGWFSVVAAFEGVALGALPSPDITDESDVLGHGFLSVRPKEISDTSDTTYYDGSSAVDGDNAINLDDFQRYQRVAGVWTLDADVLQDDLEEYRGIQPGDYLIFSKQYQDSDFRGWLFRELRTCLNAMRYRAYAVGRNKVSSAKGLALGSSVTSAAAAETEFYTNPAYGYAVDTPGVLSQIGMRAESNRDSGGAMEYHFQSECTADTFFMNDANLAEWPDYTAHYYVGSEAPTAGLGPGVYNDNGEGLVEDTYTLWDSAAGSGGTPATSSPLGAIAEPPTYTNPGTNAYTNEGYQAFVTSMVEFDFVQGP